MGFTVDYKELDSIYNNIVDARGSWMTALENIYNAVNAISVSAYINGNGASNVKNYMSTTHGFIIDSLANIIEAHYNNYVLYKQDYHSNIDTALHARILQDELADIGKYMQDVSLPGTVEVDEAIQSALAEVSDLFYSGFPGAQPVEDANLDIQESLVKLDEDITNLENNHQNTDFNEIAELIASLTAFINSQISNGRSYKSTFTVESLRNDSSLARLGEARQTLGDAQAAKNTALVQAFENEQVRQDLLREEREREAAAVNWAVTGLCFVASIGVIVVTGGTGAPAAVIITSTITQSLSSATREATAQYVEKGNMSLIDWGDVGEEAFWGGVSGAVTGTVGYYGGDLIAKGFQQIKPVANLMNSGSKVVRILSNGTIQSINEVGTGVATRFIGESITNGGDLGAAWEAATDKMSMLIDAGVGYGSGALRGIKSPGSTPDTPTVEDIDGITGGKGARVKDIADPDGVVLLNDSPDAVSDTVQALKGVDGQPTVGTIGQSEESKKVREIIEKVENNEIILDGNKMKCNYGEMKMDILLEEMGYERMGPEGTRVLGLDAKMHKGIDGVYYKPDGNPPYIIAEAKYGKSNLNPKTADGPQMSDGWIRGSKRLEKAVGDNAIANKILNSDYNRMVVHVSPNGSVTTSLLNEAGKVIK